MTNFEDRDVDPDLTATLTAAAAKYGALGVILAAMAQWPDARDEAVRRANRDRHDVTRARLDEINRDYLCNRKCTPVAPSPDCPVHRTATGGYASGGVIPTPVPGAPRHVQRMCGCARPDLADDPWDHPRHPYCSMWESTYLRYGGEARGIYADTVEAIERLDNHDRPVPDRGETDLIPDPVDRRPWWRRLLASRTGA